MGDMAATRVDGEFSLVYLVFNTIFNLTTQDGQVALLPERRRAPAQRRALRDRGARAGAAAAALGADRPALARRPGGMSYYVYDVVTQRLSGQHYYLEDGRSQASPTEMRYAWPAELDLMARLAGMRLEHRWAGGAASRSPASAPRTCRSTRSR